MWIEPELVYSGLVGTENIGFEAVAYHQGFVATGVGVDQGEVENSFMRLLDTGIFRQDHSFEVRSQSGVAELLVLYFAEAVR